MISAANGLLRFRFFAKFSRRRAPRRITLERIGNMLLEIHEPGETPLPHAGEGTLAVGIDLCNHQPWSPSPARV